MYLNLASVERPSNWVSLGDAGASDGGTPETKQLCRYDHQEKNPQNLKPTDPTELLIGIKTNGP
jgi:hypothetical protein